VRRPRFGETGHRPVATAFVIRALDFPHHSSFGFRHFAACQSYDRKVAGARADFQMEMFPCRCHVGAARLWTQSGANNFSLNSTGVTRPSNLIRRAKYLRKIGRRWRTPSSFRRHLTVCSRGDSSSSATKKCAKNFFLRHGNSDRFSIARTSLFLPCAPR
jgi:hypothetical protein